MEAYDRAVLILSYREHSSADLRRKLLQKGHSKEEVEEALVRLEDQRLLSDERFLKERVRQLVIKSYGPHYIQAKLRTDGIDCSISKIEEIYEEMEINQSSQIDAYLSKRGIQKTSEPEQIDKLKARLLRRGFDFSEISSQLVSP